MALKHRPGSATVIGMDTDRDLVDAKRIPDLEPEVVENAARGRCERLRGGLIDGPTDAEPLVCVVISARAEGVEDNHSPGRSCRRGKGD